MNTRRILILCFAGVAFTIAIRARIWSDKHAPPVHPMRVNIIEYADPNSPYGDLGSKNLKVVATPNVAAGRYLDGPKCQWTIDPTMHRSSSTQAWQEVGRITDSLPNEALSLDKIQLPSIDTEAGDWKVTVHVAVELWDGDTKEVWSGEATREINEHFSPVDFQQRNVKRSKIEREQRLAFNRSLNETTIGKPSPIPGKKYIARIQYSRDSGQTWRDIPLPDSSDYPLVVQEHYSIGFRAIKTDPKLKWPDSLPVWDDGGPDGTYTSDTVYVVLAPPRNPVDLRTVSVRCGNQIATQIRVLPDDDLVVCSNHANVVIGAQTGSPAAPCRLSALYSLGATQQKGAKVRFSARYTDGTNADLINAPGASDDLVPVDKDGLAHAILRGGPKTGQVRISAVALAPDGNHLAQTEHDEIVDIRARWWLEEHGAQP